MSAVTSNARRHGEDLRGSIVVWIQRTYHQQRTDALAGLTPIEFGAKLTTPQTDAV